MEGINYNLFVVKPNPKPKTKPKTKTRVKGKCLTKTNVYSV